MSYFTLAPTVVAVNSMGLALRASDQTLAALTLLPQDRKSALAISISTEFLPPDAIADKVLEHGADKSGREA